MFKLSEKKISDLHMRKLKSKGKRAINFGPCAEIVCHLSLSFIVLGYKIFVVLYVSNLLCLFS